MDRKEALRRLYFTARCVACNAATQRTVKKAPQFPSYPYPRPSLASPMAIFFISSMDASAFFHL